MLNLWVTRPSVCRCVAKYATEALTFGMNDSLIREVTMVLFPTPSGEVKHL